MSKEQKHKEVKEVEGERYVIDVEDWKASCAFNPNGVSTKLDPLGGYNESTTITLSGKIISPPLQDVLHAKIEIAGLPNPDGREKQEKTDDDSLQVIGSMVSFR